MGHSTKGKRQMTEGGRQRGGGALRLRSALLEDRCARGARQRAVDRRQRAEGGRHKDYSLLVYQGK